MTKSVTVAECARLNRIADVIQVELTTWLEGNGVVRDGQWCLEDDAEEWLKVRCFKLRLAVRDLRAFTLKHQPEGKAA